LADPPPPAPVAPGKTALAGVCPRCGKGRLFAGIITFAPKCSVCGLDFQAFNVGDGAASFLILIVGAIVTGLAMWLELTRSPPWYVHALLWGPLALVLTLGFMRIAKGLLIALEFRHEAHQGKL
jgi:uncharacterized protein (DUF983 family)